VRLFSLAPILALALIAGQLSSYTLGLVSVEDDIAWPDICVSNGHPWTDYTRIVLRTDAPGGGGGWGPNKRVVITRTFAVDAEAVEYVNAIGATQIERNGTSTACASPQSLRFESWVAVFSDWRTPLSPIVAGRLD
jgi:hypothetical protein